MLHGSITNIPNGVRGFDCNGTVHAATAKAFFDHGYRFAVRYVRRDGKNSYDLTAEEATDLLNAGLAVMPVQHFGPGEGWTPTDDLGRQYGQAASDSATAIGFPPGTNVWLDLEGINPAVAKETVIRYCNYWHDRVLGAGFLPGIYVGVGARLNPTELYARLKFARYWGAYNLNRDQEPATRGLCMKQHMRDVDGSDGKFGINFQVDTVTADAKGGRPVVLAPQGWSSSLQNV